MQLVSYGLLIRKLRGTIKLDLVDFLRKTKVFHLQNTRKFHFRNNCQLLGKSSLTPACFFVALLYYQIKTTKIMNYLNPFQETRFMADLFAEKSSIKNNLDSNEDYCDKHAIDDFYCDLD